jgi:hypothetical protein
MVFGLQAGEQQNCISVKMSRQALWPKQLPNQWVPGLFPRGKSHRWWRRRRRGAGKSYDYHAVPRAWMSAAVMPLAPARLHEVYKDDFI